MVIKINGSEVEWSAPGFKVLCEVIPGIQEWLGQQGWSMKGVVCDGMPYTEEDSQKSLDKCQLLEVQADHFPTQMREHIDLLKDFIDLVIRGIDKKPEELLLQVREVWVELSPVLPQVFGPALGPRERSILDSLNLAIGEGWDTLAEIRESLNSLQVRLEQVSVLLSHPDKAIVHLRKRLSVHLEKAKDIPFLYQSGHEKAASSALLETLDILDLLFLWYQVAAVAKEVPEEAQEAARFLKELQASLENADWILSGDLLEYEILPRLTLLSQSDTLEANSGDHETTGTA